MKQFFPIASAAALMLSTATCHSPAAESHEIFLGEPASPAAAGRTINIGPETTWLEARAGEAVKFVVGDKTFTWNFDRVTAISKFDMEKIAPPGVLDHQVVIYLDGRPRD